jgi:hypothetical protein
MGRQYVPVGMGIAAAASILSAGGRSSAARSRSPGRGTGLEAARADNISPAVSSGCPLCREGGSRGCHRGFIDAVS